MTSSVVVETTRRGAGEARRTLRVALGQYDIGWHDPATSLDRAASLVERAAGEGARLIALPEMCATGFTMDSARWAESLYGESGRRLSSIAAAHDVWLIAGLSARDGNGPFNAAVVIDPAGATRAVYRKQRLFAFGGEHRSYAPGASPVIVEIDGVRVAPFICYDLRFPELFRAVARDVDAMVLVANWPAARRSHWDALVRARAIENQCWFVAVNRTGEGGSLSFDGGSVVVSPWGDVVATGDTSAEIDAVAVAELRAKYPFLSDM